MSDKQHQVSDSEREMMVHPHVTNTTTELKTRLDADIETTNIKRLPDIRIRRAAGTVLVLQGFNLVGTLLSLVAVPLYLQWLGREGYGLLLTGLAFAGYLSFADVGLSWASVILIAQASGRDDRRKIAAIVRNSVSLALISVFVVACFAVACFTALVLGTRVPFFPDDPGFPKLLAVVAASVCLSLLNSPFNGLYSGLQRGYIAGVFQGFGRLFGTCAALFVAYSGGSVAGVLLANVVVGFLFNVGAAVTSFKLFPWAFVRGPLWERDQIRTQLHTGLKNFGMQIGGVLVGTAPVLAISSQLGAAAVPLFTVPFMLINLPLSLFFTVNAALQSGYGEAHARGDSSWITRTIRLVFEHLLLAITLLSVGYFFVGADFITVWTRSKLHVELPELFSAWLVAVPVSILSVFRFALAGLNRQRMAAVSEILFGLLALTFGTFATNHFGIDGVGPSVLLAALCTSAWVLPSQLRNAFQHFGFLPDPVYLSRLALVLAVSIIAGVASHQISIGLIREVAIAVQVVGITTAFVLAAAKLMPEVYRRIHRIAFDSVLMPLRDRFLRSVNAN